MSKITALINVLGVVKDKTVQTIIAIVLGVLLVAEVFFEKNVYEMRIQSLEDKIETLREANSELMYDLRVLNPTPKELGYYRNENGQMTREINETFALVKEWELNKGMSL
ncbi:hypothetical protein [Vibrio sp. ER1A]|uniref:hypothetical protein n=1 Tax=Vibrio sp. ER1A TaxID=1517681 RepID=UPI0004DD7D54|nr:hypothetical protein [Vibrio sp. ER1A]KFA99225.1 hypothetical protein HW45_05095 [Vibrio sp. ER1A]